MDEQESTAAASSGDSEENGAAKQSGTLSLPPATLAKALPHIRRLMPREEGEAAASALELLRGGRLQFPDKRVAGASAKVGEVRGFIAKSELVDSGAFFSPPSAR